MALRPAALLAVAVVIAAGCSADLHWAKPGVTVADFQRDSYECAQRSTQHVFRVGPAPLIMMQSHGDADRINKELYRG